jgi:arginyl-tRNA synthetase
MEDGDEEALGLWRRFRDFSIRKLEKTYARLNIHFDVYGGESVVRPESMEEALNILEQKGLLCEEKGGVLVDLTKHKLDKAVVKKNGESC